MFVLIIITDKDLKLLSFNIEGLSRMYDNVNDWWNYIEELVNSECERCAF